MVAWNFDEKDQKIEFLIKTMKKRHLEDTLKKGRFCFNFPSVFNFQSNLASAQQDKWDSHLTYEVTKLICAPVISDQDEDIKYGPIIELADRAQLRTISNKSKATPLCSFRKVDSEDFVYKYDVAFFRLGELVDRVKSEFQHDAFVLIFHPHLFIKRLSQVERCFARSIHYGEIDEEFQNFLDLCKFDQKEMFQKAVDYEWQKEFRVVLPPRHASGPQIIEIGSIEDIAFGGDIETLRRGFIFGENEEAVKKAMDRIKVDGDVYEQLQIPTN